MLRKLSMEEDRVGTTQYLSFVRADFVEPLREFYKDKAKNGIVDSYYEFAVVSTTGDLIWVGQTGRCEFGQDGRLLKISFIGIYFPFQIRLFWWIFFYRQLYFFCLRFYQWDR
jgi:hypothetical protein